jgi:DNA-3-methyladenine glycosylase
MSREELAACPVLPREFYGRPTVAVARDLLGRILVHGDCAGRIVEVEAYPETYRGVVDRAAHSSRGRTARTEVIFGPPGHAYVYLIYGRYECLNLIAEPEGTPGCVLIRALEPLVGIEKMRQRRPAAAKIEDLAAGPGKLTLALEITRAANAWDVTRSPLRVLRGESVPRRRVAVSPRIGIRECADWPLRFALAGSPFVSRRPARGAGY